MKGKEKLFKKKAVTEQPKEEVKKKRTKKTKDVQTETEEGREDSNT